MIPTTGTRLELDFQETLSLSTWDTLKGILDSHCNPSVGCQLSSPSSGRQVMLTAHTRIASGGYDPHMPFPRVTEFMAESMCRSAEGFAKRLVEFAQRRAEIIDSHTEQLKEYRRLYGTSGEDIRVEPGLQNMALVVRHTTGVAASVVSTASVSLVPYRWRINYSINNQLAIFLVSGVCSTLFLGSYLWTFHQGWSYFSFIQSTWGRREESEREYRWSLWYCRWLNGSHRTSYAWGWEIRFCFGSKHYSHHFRNCCIEVSLFILL